MKRTIVDESGQKEVDIPPAEAAAIQAGWAAYILPPPPQKTLAELEAQLEALAAQIAAMKQST
jgi:hypothetical protein